MEKTLFNLHDLILLLTAFQCFTLAWVIYATRKSFGVAYVFLAAFFLSHSFIALHELTLWGAAFRNWVLELSPNIFFAFNFSYFIDAPLLYLYIQSQLNKSFELNYKHTIHAVPVLFLLVYLWWAFWGLPVSEKAQLIISHDIAYSSHYVLTDLAGKLLRLGYLGVSLYLVIQYLRQNTEFAPTRIRWLKYFIIAFIFIACWETLLTGIKVFGLKFSINLDLLQIIGVSDYYFQFALINYVIYIMVIEALKSGGIKKIKKEEPVDLEMVANLETAMKEKKCYLNPYLSFERLAEQLDVPSKDLSAVINRHYNVNFYEFINEYRVNEAKQQLADVQNKHKNITDIFYGAGFNSKSVYNTLFKKKFAMTPSEFRKKSLQNQGS